MQNFQLVNLIMYTKDRKQIIRLLNKYRVPVKNQSIVDKH